MEQFQSVLNIITQVIAELKKFFLGLLDMFKGEENAEGENAEV